MGRTRPDDDFMHPSDDVPQFNESVYYNFCDPGAAFKGNPHERCRVDLPFRAVADTFWPWVPAGDGTPEGFDAVLHQAFARNHLNQHMTATGTVTVGDRSFTVEDGLGWRDRS